VAFDVAAPAAALGQAIGHLGCLITGDSYGLPTDAPWALIYRNPAAMAPQGVPLHPTQAYEAIFLGVLFVSLWVSRRRLESLGHGVMAAAYLLGLAAIRFVLFFARDEAPVLAGLKTAQIIGLGIAVLGIVVLVVARRRARIATVPTHQLEAAFT
jgi:phosphatidylglycerol:prolipoprotein diacylglycerol transferase